MGVMDVTAESLAAMFKEIGPHLDERQRRLLMGAQARALGHGGIRLVAGAAGVREATVSLGAGELARQGRKIGADTVGDLLREEGFSLQGNVKTMEGKQHPDRDAQFRYIAAQAGEHM